MSIQPIDVQTVLGQSGNAVKGMHNSLHAAELQKDTILDKQVKTENQASKVTPKVLEKEETGKVKEKEEQDQPESKNKSKGKDSHQVQQFELQSWRSSHSPQEF